VADRVVASVLERRVEREARRHAETTIVRVKLAGFGYAVQDLIART